MRGPVTIVPLMNARILLLLLAFVTLSGISGADDTRYGFTGFEIYKLENGISGLTVCDVDKDGLLDLLVINNRKAKIEVLLRRKDPVPPKTKTGEKPPNDLVYDRFFERKEILTEKQVWDLAAADLNGDGKLDVAYYGKPDELVIAYGDGKGGFPTTKSFTIEDVKSSGSGLEAGDLDGDGRADLALISKGYTSIYYQSDKGELLEPRKVPHAVKAVTAVGIHDLNGDKRMDLLHFVPASPRSVRARFQAPDGSLGAEIAFETPAWRTLDLHDVAPTPGDEVVVVQRTSGVLRTLRMSSEPAKGSVPLGTPQLHAFEVARGGKPRSMAIGDINGDKRLDLVVTEPGTAQVAVYLQRADGKLAGRRTFPSLSDASAVRVADTDGDGRAEIVVLSLDERAIGVTSMKEGRLPFPSFIDVGGVPKAFDIGDAHGDAKPEIVVAVEKDKKQWLWGIAEKPVELKDLKNPPDDLMVMDLDQDGKNDVLLFDKFGPLRVRFADNGEVVKINSLKKLDRGNVGLADIDGDGKAELLVTDKNFARAVLYDRKKGIRIKDQANGRAPTSQVKGAVTLDVDGDGKAEVALFDREKRVVTVLKRGEGGVFEIAANLPVGELDYRAIFSRDINGDKRADLVVFGRNRFAVLYAGGQTHALVAVHSVESTMRDAHLDGFAVGDLNGDKDPDIALIDSGNRAVQLFSYNPEKGFKQRIHWSVYEKKMHENRRRGRSGVREIVVADLDGNGADDIALIVHDRVIVYPR